MAVQFHETVIIGRHLSCLDGIADTTVYSFVCEVFGYKAHHVY